MIYYTIYVRDLHNQTGYIDIALEDEQLLKDYTQYLDIGLRSNRSYRVTNVAGTRAKSGWFAINVENILAITTTASQS